MATLRQFIARLGAFFRGSDLDRDFSDEMNAHLEMAVEDNLRKGMTPIEARRQAALKLGGATSLRLQHRDARGFRFLDDLVQDLRFASRLMMRDRWLSAAAIAAIALGIGANTVGFTIVNAAFLRGFPFDHAEELRAISWQPDRGRRNAVSVLDLEDWRSQSSSFTAMAATMFGAINISDDHAAPEQTQGARVTANLFDVLRQPPLLGRTFVAGEDRRDAEPVVIIGYDIWTRRFDRDSSAIGRILRINGSPATIIGVMPDGMKFPDNSELWLPFIPTDAQMARGVRPLSVFGRLRSGVSDEQAETELDGIAQRIKSANPDQTKGLAGGQLETLVERFLGGAARPMFITVMGAVIFVLLIACANVANLLLSRSMYRAREVAVRYTLGATRWRIIRQLLIESVALSTIGGVLGLALAWYGVGAFEAAVRAADAPYWLRFTIDFRVFGYVAVICIATGILFGLAPALHVSATNQADTLKDGARGSFGARRANRFGQILIIGELALTVVLLCGAGLMVRSFIALYATEPGFVVDGLSRMRMQLPPSNYPTADARLRFYEQLQPRIEAIPGVQRVAFSTGVPPLAGGEIWRFEVQGGADVDNDSRPWVSTVTITPNYFDVLGVAINRGRALTTADGAAGSENIVISQVMANRYFDGQDPVGQRIRFVPRDDDTEPQPWRTIVGVSAPLLQGASDEAFRSPVVYLPLRQSAPRTASVIIRSGLPIGSVMTAVRSAVQSIDLDQPVFTIETLDAVLANERLIYRIFSTLFGVLALIGLILSAVGVYGVMAYAVTQRTQEIGVRMAIGAKRWDVSWLFLRKGLMQLALALLIGVPAAIGLGAIAQFRLVEIEPSDPVTMIAVTVVLTVVAVAACVLPARKAARVDPVNALRAE